MAAKKLIGRYQIKKELGRGGMATVYKAFDPMFDREVAVKVLPRELLHNPQFHKRFAREAKTVARLEHAAIVPVYDVGEDNEQPYFVMRLMAGGSLADKIRQGPLNLQESASILKKIAAGLDYAHKKGIVHRDLKPGNILFDETGNPFLSDFGIAKIANLSQQTNLTGSGGIIGTAAYMSPEQAQGLDVDYRSDIYALGVILYEMLSGKPPYDSNTPMGIAIKHITDPIPRILESKPDLPESIQAVIDKALAKNPEERYPSASGFAEALDLALSGKQPDLSAAALAPTRAIVKPDENAPATAVPETAPTQSPPPKMLWLAGAGALLALIGVVAVFSLFTAHPEPPAIAETPSPIPATATTAPPTATSIPASPTPEPSPEPTLAQAPGGSDQAAFITANDIWMLDLSGATQPIQLTTNRREKILMQWLPNGEEILYRENRCIYTIRPADKVAQVVICLQSSEIEGASISPDGSKLALTIDRVLFILPFERASVAAMKDRGTVSRAATCSYSQVAAKSVRWARDGNGLAVSYVALTGTGRKDLVRVLDISNCQTSSPVAVQDFPGDIFIPDGYRENPTLTTFDWDGGSGFLLNTFKRNDGYGDLYFYDMATQQAKKLNPIEGACCYRDARFSADGTHLVFSFQDERQGLEARTRLFYIPLEQALQGGMTFDSLSLPVDLLRIAREKPMLVLRPAP
jgi:serine/threonine-protein kinase